MRAIQALDYDYIYDMFEKFSFQADTVKVFLYNCNIFVMCHA